LSTICLLWGLEVSKNHFRQAEASPSHRSGHQWCFRALSSPLCPADTSWPLMAT
jgi:hypothetical protein